MFIEYLESPIGTLSVCANEEAVVKVIFGKCPSTAPNNITNECVKQLKEYFKGDRESFDLPLQPEGTDFQLLVWRELQKISFGKSISYSQLAIALGDLKKIRAAGTANGKNKIPIIIPCHRVIGKDGSLVGFAGGLDKKEWLLKHEGIIKGEQMSIFNFN